MNDSKFINEKLVNDIRISVIITAIVLLAGNFIDIIIPITMGNIGSGLSLLFSLKIPFFILICYLAFRDQPKKPILYVILLYAVITVIYSLLVPYNTGLIDYNSVSVCYSGLESNISKLSVIIAMFLLVFRKESRFIEIIAFINIVIGVWGILYYGYYQPHIAIVHYFIFHYLLGLLIAFIYPLDGWTKLLCYTTGISKSVRYSVVLVTALVIVGGLYIFIIKEFNFHWIQTPSAIMIILVFYVVVLLFLFIAFEKYSKQHMGHIIELEEAEAKTHKALDYNKTLLSEVHHRIKNNLAIISSLLKVEERNVVDETAKNALKTSRKRVDSIANLHKSLYTHNEFGKVHIDSYLQGIVDSLKDNAPADNIDIILNSEDLELDLDYGIPLGLIVNELIINSFKYAFPDGRDGKITIEFYQENNECYLKVSDNGVGCSLEDLNRSAGIGQSVIASLTQQIGGQLQTEIDNGITSIIIFEI